MRLLSAGRPRTLDGGSACYTRFKKPHSATLIMLVMCYTKSTCANFYCVCTLIDEDNAIMVSCICVLWLSLSSVFEGTNFFKSAWATSK